MKTRFTNGLDEQEATIVKYEFEKAVRFRSMLKEQLSKDIDGFITSMTKEDNFESPSWALQQADRIAQIKAYTKIIALLE